MPAGLWRRWSGGCCSERRPRTGWARLFHPLLALLILPAGAVAASTRVPWDGAACKAASAAVERTTRLPPQILDAIGVVESGRMDPARGVVTPWPWSIDVGGAGHFYASKSEAVAAVETLQANGITSIDVGCMQINLRDHPDAFASLDEAFDPRANTAFAGRFLLQLFRQTGSWPLAAAAYHSQTPALGMAYRDQVMAVWPFADRYGGSVGHVVSVDPYHVLTPAFRTRLLADAAFRAARDDRLHLVARASRLSDRAPARRRQPSSLAWRDAAR